MALAMALAYRNTLRYELADTKDIHSAVEKTTPRLPWITTPDELTVWAVALGLKQEIDQAIVIVGVCRTGKLTEFAIGQRVRRGRRWRRRRRRRGLLSRERRRPAQA